MSDNTITKENIPTDWIKMGGETFGCAECENNSKPLTNTEAGMVEADMGEIKRDLEKFPTKIIYAVCPVCGMEYVVKLVEGEVYLEPSNELK